MTSKSPMRSCEDVDEVTLSFAEIKALCAGNPLIKEKIELDNSVVKLKMLKSNHNNEQYRLEDDVLKRFPKEIKEIESRIKNLTSDFEHLKTIPEPPENEINPMTIQGSDYTDKEQAGLAIIAACYESKEAKKTLVIGNYKGFDISVDFETPLFGNSEYKLRLKRGMTYTLPLGNNISGLEDKIVNSIDNIVESISRSVQSSQSQLETVQSQLENSKSELGAPFKYENELSTKLKRLAELNIALNIDGKQTIAPPALAAEKLPPPIAPAVIADKPPKSIYGKMKYYADKIIPPKNTDGIKPKSRNDTELQ
jgi:DNA repair exonuclease SbcCD ATPase subunit